MGLLKLIDDFFCRLEGKQENAGVDGIGTRFINTLLKDDSSTNGLEGINIADKENFKTQLINDIKTGLFGSWKKEWKPDARPNATTVLVDKNGKPINYRNINGREYGNASNILTLGMATKESPFFCTKDYIEKNGGKVTDTRKWAMITSIVPLSFDKAKDAQGHILISNQTHITKKGEQTDFVVPKFQNVISTDYVDGIKIPEFSVQELTDGEKLEYIENIINAIKKTGRTPKYFFDQADRCFYVPATDEIHMVKSRAFNIVNAYYSTLFHETIHSTGAPHRLNRKIRGGGFGSPEYGFEELVAEMGALIFCTEFSLDYTRQNSISYLQSWLKAAKKIKTFNDNEDIVLLKAYGFAVDAVEYLLKDVEWEKLLPKSVTEKAKDGTKTAQKPQKPQKKAKTEPKPDKKTDKTPENKPTKKADKPKVSEKTKKAIEHAKKIGIVTKVPKGWIEAPEVMTTPQGYVAITNGKTPFPKDGEEGRKILFIKKEDFAKSTKSDTPKTDDSTAAVLAKLEKLLNEVEKEK